LLKKMILIMITAAMLTGCASSGLVHDKNYLRAVSVSGRERLEMTLAFFSDDEENVNVSGKDLDSALKNAEMKTGKPIFTGYTELVILGDCEYRNVLEEMLNSWKVSPSCTVAYSESGGAVLRKNGAELLSGQIKRAEKQDIVRDSNIVKVLEELLGEQQSAEVPEAGMNGISSGIMIS